jgi:hypothetical protein
MSQEIRSQRKCYYASAGYSASLWGKFGYLYEGKGRLRLTTDGLGLEVGGRDLTIPFGAIKGIGLGRFSSWSKPFGLEYLAVRYQRDGDLETIRLVPHEGPLDPSWSTSELVESWFRTLEQIEELSGRIEPPTFDPVTPPSMGKLGIFAAGMAVFSIGAILLGFLVTPH